MWQQMGRSAQIPLLEVQLKWCKCQLCTECLVQTNCTKRRRQREQCQLQCKEHKLIRSLAAQTRHQKANTPGKVCMFYLCTMAPYGPHGAHFALCSFSALLACLARPQDHLVRDLGQQKATAKFCRPRVTFATRLQRTITCKGKPPHWKG